MVSKKDLRKFGLTLGAGFAVLGAIVLWRGKGFYPYLFCVSAAFLLIGLLVPGLLRPVRRVWMRAAEAMGWFMTRVILALVFYLGFTPMGVIGRLLGKRFLEMDPDPSAQTYWQEKVSLEVDKGSYEKQY